jgi:hypothetical protein
MKSNYIEIINTELPKLTEDQLYKLLVLIKNTTTQLPYENRVLFSKDNVLFKPNEPLEADAWSPEIVERTKKNLEAESILLRTKLVDMSFNDCYGVFNVVGRPTFKHAVSGLSVYVMFCKLNEFDGAVEMFELETERETLIGYQLSIHVIGHEPFDVSVKIFYNRDDLYNALDVIAKEMNKYERTK